MSAVYLITGIQAAGKSTVAQALAERLPRAAHVRGDAFRRMIVSGGVPMTPDAGEEAGCPPTVPGTVSRSGGARVDAGPTHRSAPEPLEEPWIAGPGC